MYRTAGSQGAESEGGNTPSSGATGVTADWGHGGDALVPEGGEHVSVEIVGPSWGERQALSRSAWEAGLQGTCR